MFKGTTICGVLKDGKCAIAGDGQITMGEKVIMKGTAVKVRRIYESKVIIGFAGTVSDALALSEKFESALEQYNGNLMRAAVELARAWRSDKALRKLEALMLVSDGSELLLVSGTGEVIEPENGLCAIGSGGNYALAAAKALQAHTGLSPAEIARQAVEIAADICVFTNHNIIVEEVSAC